MKFLHLADLHLGRSLNEVNLLEDQRYILREIADLAEQNHVDAVLIAGDVYDKPVPSGEAVNLLNDFLVRLRNAGILVYMISGNHDSDDRLQFGSTFLARSGVYIAGRYEGTLVEETFTDEYSDAYGPVHLYLMPFLKAPLVSHYHPEFTGKTTDEAVRFVLESAGIDSAARNVCIAHQFVTAGDSPEAAPELAGSEMILPQTVGTVEQTKSDAFDCFAYVALGHIHRPQQVGRPEVRYAGSPLKYSLSECRGEKSVPLVTMTGDSVKIELLPLRARRDLRHIEGPFEKLLNEAVDTDDYIYATLTDENRVLDAMARLRAAYPNALHIDYRGKNDGGTGNGETEAAAQPRDLDTLLGDFYCEMFGGQISEAELKILKEAAENAGIEEGDRW